MPNPIEMVAAWFRFHWNEVSLDSKQGVDDPVKFRLGSFDSEYLGAITGDVLHGDSNNPQRKEKIIIALKRFGPGPEFGGMVEVFVQDAGTADDGGMRRAVTITPERIEFHKPVVGLPSGSGGESDDIESSNGQYRLIVQNDGNVVLYDKTTGQPLWDRHNGDLR